MKKVEIIKGTYSPEEAKEILFNIINAKIDFHNMRIVSSQIRYNQPDTNSQKRIKELNNSYAQLELLIAEAAEGNHDLTINSTIELTLTPKKEEKIAL